jgi:broad specificity phosphatase PhoE
MKIFLIRHWATIEWENNIILGHLDWNLSQNGVLQMNLAWRFLSNWNFWIDKIITSKLKRAINSWEIINNFLKLNLEANELLNERWAWIAEWKKENDINWQSHKNLPLLKKKHKWWENFEKVNQRILTFLGTLNKKKNENLLLVSHSVIIYLFLAIYHNSSLEEIFKININDKIICINLETKNVEFINLMNIN